MAVVFARGDYVQIFTDWERRCRVYGVVVAAGPMLFTVRLGNGATRQFYQGDGKIVPADDVAAAATTCGEA